MAQVVGHYKLYKHSVRPPPVVYPHLQWKTLQHPHLMVLPSERSLSKWSASSIELKYKLYEIEWAPGELIPVIRKFEGSALVQWHIYN